MRASTLCLVFGLVPLMAWNSEASPDALAVPEKCCFEFIGFKIPPGKIKSALKTGAHCPVAGVVVTTQRDLEFCVKADEPWIKAVMEKQPGK